MLVLLILVFVILSLISYIEDDLETGTVQLLFLAMVVVMALIVGLRPEGIDHDYSHYIEMYNKNYEITTEFTFILIANFVSSVFDNHVYLFLTYAILSLALKYLVIKKMSKLHFLSLLMALCTFYILHDFNQIRAGVASGFVLLAIPYLFEGKRWKYVLFIALGICFHYSAIVMLGFVFLSGKPFTKLDYCLYGAIIPISYVCYFLHIDPFFLVPIPYFEEKLEAYQALQETKEAYEANVFNLVIVVKIAISYYLLIMSKVIEEKNQYFPLLLKFEIFALASFILFTKVPILSFRLNELIGVVEYILFPLIFYTIKPEWISRGVVIVMAFVLLIINIFFNQFLYL